MRSAEAQLRSSEAQVTQAQASLNQNKVNLEHTVIDAPIDGLVISRNVDVGQTVAASMQAPTLFVLAADLTKMQVVANLDESDVGRIRPGQHVTFRVDAYPAEDFDGTVSQVRLQPIVQQNVVTYATVIDVPEPRAEAEAGHDGERQHRDRAAAPTCCACRTRRCASGRPTRCSRRSADAAGSGPAGRSRRRAGRAGQTMPRLAGAPASRAARQRAPTVRAAARRAEVLTARQAGASRRRCLARSAPARRRWRGTRPRRSGGDRARMQDMTPEEREQMLQRMRARGCDPAAAGAGGRGGASGASAQRGAVSAPARPSVSRESTPRRARNPAATTIDALFGPLPRSKPTAASGCIPTSSFEPLRLRLGITDGRPPSCSKATSARHGGRHQRHRPADETPAGRSGGFPVHGQPGRGGFRRRRRQSRRRRSRRRRTRRRLTCRRS